MSLNNNKIWTFWDMMGFKCHRVVILCNTLEVLDQGYSEILNFNTSYKNANFLKKMLLRKKISYVMNQKDRFDERLNKALIELNELCKEYGFINTICKN